MAVNWVQLDSTFRYQSDESCQCANVRVIHKSSTGRILQTKKEGVYFSGHTFKTLSCWNTPGVFWQTKILFFFKNFVASAKHAHLHTAMCRWVGPNKTYYMGCVLGFYFLSNRALSSLSVWMEGLFSLPAGVVGPRCSLCTILRAGAHYQRTETGTPPQNKMLSLLRQFQLPSTVFTRKEGAPELWKEKCYTPGEVQLGRTEERTDAFLFKIKCTLQWSTNIHSQSVNLSDKLMFLNLWLRLKLHSGVQKHCRFHLSSSP